jgi:hypothetical protein
VQPSYGHSCDGTLRVLTNITKVYWCVGRLSSFDPVT